MKHFDGVSDADAAKLETPFGDIVVYTFEETSKLPTVKEVIRTDITPPHG